MEIEMKGRRLFWWPSGLRFFFLQNKRDDRFVTKVEVKSKRFSTEERSKEYFDLLNDGSSCKALQTSSSVVWTSKSFNFQLTETIYGSWKASADTRAKGNGLRVNPISIDSHK